VALDECQLAEKNGRPCIIEAKERPISRAFGNNGGLLNARAVVLLNVLSCLCKASVTAAECCHLTFVFALSALTHEGSFRNEREKPDCVSLVRNDELLVNKSSNTPMYLRCECRFLTLSAGEDNFLQSSLSMVTLLDVNAAFESL
jgi:hypothetical protein